MIECISRLLKNAHLRRCPYSSSLRRTSKYASLLRIAGAWHLGIFEQPAENYFFNSLLDLINNFRPCQIPSCAAMLIACPFQKQPW